LGVTVLLALPASADDDKVYSGFACAEEGSDTGAFNRSVFRITRTGSSGTGRILCPVIRDNVGDCGDGLDSTGPIAPIPACKYSVEVHTFRSFTAQVDVPEEQWDQAGPVQCTLFARDFTGNLIGFQTKSAGRGVDTMRLDAVNGGTNTGSYGMSCSMPVNGVQFAKIFSYKVVE
jgi:hypothetical protein